VSTRSSRSRMAAVTLMAGLVLPLSAAAQSTPSNWEAGKWKVGATVYAYLPSIGGQMKFPVDTGGSSLNVDADQIIDSLKFTFMGSLDVHNGRWGLFTDVIYLDVGGSKSNTRDFSIGNSGIPAGTTADLDLDLKGWVWTLAGEYRVAADPAWTVDVLAGARMLDIQPTLDWAIQGDLGPITGPGRTGTREISETVWDGIVGVKGRYNFGENRRWGVPFYADIGTGESDLTWQAAAGVSYAFGWGEVVGMWRYLDYKFKSGKQLEDINFNGPMLGVTFRW
jgi:hypothetical protein